MNYTICFLQVDGEISGCFHGYPPFDMPITIGTIPLRDDFESSAINSGGVISGQPISFQKPMGEATPMLPPQLGMQMPMQMPALPNQNGPFPYPNGPSGFPEMPTGPYNEKGIPGAPPSVPTNAFAPSAPDFGQSKSNGPYFIFCSMKKNENNSNFNRSFHFRSTVLRGCHKYRRKG